MKERRQMPLDPDKLHDASEKAVNLSKRFDAFMERRANAEDGPENEDEEDDDLLEPAEEATRATPGSELANPDMNETLV
jgi:hypothetical protein